MSEVSTTQRITQEELQGTAEEQISALIRPLNLFFEDTNRALDRDLTVQQNMDASILRVRIQTAASYPGNWVEVKFQHGMKRRPSGAMMINIVDNNNFDTVFISPITIQTTFDSTQGTLKFVTGLVPSGDFTLTLLIL